jgi:hypothetical protein
MNAVKKDNEEALKEMWVTVSGLGLWLNEQDMGAFMGTTILSCPVVHHADCLQRQRGR